MKYNINVLKYVTKKRNIYLQDYVKYFTILFML